MRLFTIVIYFARYTMFLAFPLPLSCPRIARLSLSRFWLFQSPCGVAASNGHHFNSRGDVGCIECSPDDDEDDGQNECIEDVDKRAQCGLHGLGRDMRMDEAHDSGDTPLSEADASVHHGQHRAFAATRRATGSATWSWISSLGVLASIWVANASATCHGWAGSDVVTCLVHADDGDLQLRQGSEAAGCIPRAGWRPSSRPLSGMRWRRWSAGEEQRGFGEGRDDDVLEKR